MPETLHMQIRILVFLAICFNMLFSCAASSVLAEHLLQGILVGFPTSISRASVRTCYEQYYVEILLNLCVSIGIPRLVFYAAPVCDIKNYIYSTGEPGF